VPEAIAQCRRAGIKVVMITGDYPATARFIADQAGIRDGELLTGDEVAALDDVVLANRIRSATVFARIMPEQKLRLVQAFRRDGGVVAMTGDGVNDAPSLKAADIGIAMGKRGTDVAREASTLVLLDDDFGSIVKAIRLGRRIYDNVRKAMAFVFAVHVPIAGLALLPLLLGKPLLLGPIHIALLEMIIDPVCALVFEAEREERGVMRRPPRDPHEALFSRRMVGWSLAQGLLALSLLGGIWWMAMEQGLPENEVRGLVFFALVGSILALIVANLSSGPRSGGRISRSLLIVLAAVGGLSMLAYLSAAVRAVLNIGPLHFTDVAAVAAVALLLTALLAGLKRVVAPIPRPDQSR
jgi:Ca2+-transporting ATPase